MLVSGQQKLERMRDGRVIYLGAERVGDVTAHPAFRHAARTIADLYELKAAAPTRDLFSFEEDGERFSMYYLRCKTREDLARRTRAIKALADATYGLIGRTPDHVAGMVTGLAMKPSVLENLGKGFGDNLVRYYEHARREDLYLAFACVPPTGIRSPDMFPGQERKDPTHVGVVYSTFDGGHHHRHEDARHRRGICRRNLGRQLDSAGRSYKKERITRAVPINAQDSRCGRVSPTNPTSRYEADYPLSYRFDETDSVLVCNRVKVPWERVFLHNNGAMSRKIYIDTPANCYANHQSNVRFWAKMGLIVGLASRICQANGVDKIPAVRETLGRLAALEAAIGGMVAGQIESWEAWPEGYACYNRRHMYAALNWCQEHHTEIIDVLRTLVGGAALQMPSSVELLQAPELRECFEQWWATPSLPALERMKLYKLAWDLIGSEFAGRHMLYEKFYAGNSIIVRNQSDREAPWERFHDRVDALLERIDVPTFDSGGSARKAAA